jgi:hypothetical protein
MPIAGWACRLFHLLFDIATRGLLVLAIAVADWTALVALAIVVPLISEASSRGMTNLCKITMALILRACSQLKILGVAHRVARARAGLDIATFVSRGLVVIVELGVLLL